MTLELRLLGEMRVVRDGSVVALPRSKKTRAILAYLVLTGREHRRDRLCELLWDVADDPRAALRWVLSRLRKVVDDTDHQRVVASRSSVRFDASALRVDVMEVRAQLEEGPAALDAEALEAAAAQLGSELLEGLDLDDFDGFQSWLLAERESVVQLRRAVLTELQQRHAADPARREPYVRELAETDPLDEEARATLVQTLVALRRMKEAELQVQAGLRAMREVGRQPTGVLRAALRTPQPSTRAPAPSPAPAAPRAPTAPEQQDFVGRAADVEALQGWLDTAPATGPRVHLITGEAGIGKTRLMRQVLADSTRPLLRGEARESDARPWAVWADALAAHDALRSLLTDAGRAQSRQQILDGVCAGLSELARTDGLLVVLDDVQWCDAASAELLMAVVHDAPDVAVLLAARSGALEDNTAMLRTLRGLRRRGDLSQHALSVLTDAEITELVQPIAPTRDEQVVRSAGGNPLFALELARSPADEPLPSTLSELVRDRLSVLSGDAQAVLRWASVLGAGFSLQRLQRLIDLTDDGLLMAFEELERRGVATTDSDGDPFRHGLFRTVVLADLSGPRRTLMHATAARVLCEEEATNPSVVDELVRHAAAAGDASTASEACVRAGWRCIGVHATAEAAALARRGRHHAGQLPEPATTERALELWELTLAARRSEAPEQDAATVVRLAQHALDQGSAEHARLGFHLAAHLHWEHGDFSEAHRKAMRAEFVSRDAEGAGQIEAQAQAARTCLMMERDLGQAEAWLLHAQAQARSLESPPPALPLALGWLHRHRGFLDQAEVCFQRARTLAAGGEAPLIEFEALEQSTLLCVQLGLARRAATLGEELKRIGQKARGGSDAPYARAVHQLVLLHEDSDTDALDRALTSLEPTHGHRLAQLTGRAALWARSTGLGDETRRWAQICLDHATAVDSASWQLIASVLLEAEPPSGLLARATEEARRLAAHSP
ncbi:MAG: AAA family ATPase [Myxococcales bacterium]|nr:AAA family ATPase [Myxococcales bacterium]